MPFPLLADDRERLRNLRRQIHADPELSFDETRTAERVRNELKDIGLHAEAVTETGVVALLDTGRPGRTILIRADMDALPVQELNEHEYCSQNPGKMHACGHDGHTAILLLVARLLHRHQEELVGRFLFVFQPAEEIGAGAPAMIEAGLLDTYKPDGCIGLHLWSQTPTGDILITEGPFMASMDRFVVTVQGQGGHGAIPQHARDPIVAAAHMIVALQTTVSRTTDPLEGAVVTVGTVQGGHAFNVIPEQVQFSGTVRTFSRETQEAIEGTIRRVLNHTGEAHRVSVEIEYTRMTIPLVNDPTYCQWARQLIPTLPNARLGSSTFQTMGGEDMAFFLDRVPGVYAFVGAGNDAVGASYPHHHPRFEIDEAALPLGVQFLTSLAQYAAQA